MVLRAFPYIPSLLLALLIVGCASVPVPSESGAVSAEEMLSQLSRTAPSPEGFSAEGSITVTTPTMDQSAGFDLASRADSLRISVYGPFGIPVGSALFTASAFTAYNSLNNTAYSGDPQKQLRMLPMMKDIPFPLLVAGLRGIHPLPPDIVPDSFQRVEGTLYSFTLPCTDGSFERYRFDASLSRITRCTRLTEDGMELWSVRYTYRRTDAGTLLPKSVTIALPSRSASLAIEYDEVSFGAPEAPLSIDIPEDAHTVTVQ